MIFGTAAKIAYSALRAKKLRTFLTVLGVSIGIAVVIAIMAAGQGLNSMILGELEMFGSDTMSIEVKVPSVKKTSSENAMGQAQGITITTLKEQDRIDIAKHPNILAAYGYMFGQEVVSYGGQTKKIMLAGEGAEMVEVEKFEMASGRIYSKEDNSSMAQVAVLGQTVKNKFFGEDAAEGKTIYIRGKPFRVIGTAAKRGAYAFIDMDNFIYIPVKTLQKRLLGVDYYSAIVAKMKDRSKSASTVADLEAIVRENHDITDPNKDDFAVNTMEEAMSMLKTIIDGIVLLLVALVCISLIVGGVGIMNIMYVSVTERVFEIGLRKALGATNRDVMWQFLLEAILLTLAGSVLGILLGALFAFFIYYAAVSYNLAWVYSIPLSSIFLSIGFSAAIGLIFGLYPAKKAAALDPIEALRRE